MPGPRTKQLPRSRNHILAALSEPDYRALRPLLEIVPLLPKQVLHNPGELSRHVYFPRGGFLSMAVVLEDGSMVEVAAIGREGMAGILARRPARTSLTNTLVVVQGGSESAYRMELDDFRAEMDRCGAFEDLVDHYGAALLGVVMQAAGCNAAHRVEQRFTKWLLMAHDRMEVAEFPITQEFVAMMLGATRQTVTGIAGILQKAGLITYHRGRVRILDRKGLERASCECYRVSTNLVRGVVGGRQRARARIK